MKMVSTAENVTYIPARKVIGVRARPDDKPMLRVAAYCRVSTDRDEQESSFEAQVEHYTEYINGKDGWLLAGIYADEGISGMNTRKREQFNLMISDCMAGKIDMVVTKSVSRFARNTIDCLEHVRKLKSRNIAVLFEKENINTLDTKGEMFLTLMASLAQQESESIGKNVTMGLQYRYQQGKVMVNYNRFLGYTKMNGRLVIDEKEAAVVRRIFREYLSGASAKRIARGLEADGIRNGAGSTKWWDSNITQILKNEKYMGDALLQKTFTVDPLEKRRLPNRGDKPQYYVEGCLDPIVSKEVFLQAQDEMARRSRAFSDDGKGPHRSYNALSGLVVCEECGKPYRRIHWNNHGCRSIVWRCKTRIGFGKTGCTSRTISEEELKNAVMDSVNEVFSNKDAIVPVLRQNISQMLTVTVDDKVKAKRNELTGLERELAADPDKETEYGDRILSLRDELDAISAEHGRRGLAISSAEELIEMLGEARIDEYSEEITRTFINSIRVFPDRLKVVFKTGLEFDVG